MLFHGLPGLEMEVGGSVGLIQRGSGGELCCGHGTVLYLEYSSGYTKLYT